MEKNEAFSSGLDKSAPSQAPRPLCIVVADDERDAVLSLMMLLREEGHETHGAYTAQQTLDAALKFEPDVVLLDIALGRSSGYDVAERIRARHGDERPLIIGISGIYKKSSDRILADLKGFNHYLVKPYEPRELLRLLAPLTQPAHRAAQPGDGPRDDTYRSTLTRAAEEPGGARPLSDRLHVPMSDLTRWLAGKERLPLYVFLRVIDILSEEASKLPKDPSA